MRTQVPIEGVALFRSRQSGFTLIELVMVIVILGILSISAVGLFAARGDFAPSLAKEQLISSARLAQQVALARQDPSLGNVSLEISESADSWTILIRQNGVNLDSRTADREGANLHISTTTFTGVCSSLPATTFPFSLTFSGDGDTNQNTRLCITKGSVSYNLCVSPAGFAYEGNC